MKISLIILTLALAGACMKKEEAKSEGHDVEHHHVTEKIDHNHEEAHHADHDHKAHHPNHDEEGSHADHAH
jgi:hypothetical protein